MPEMRWIDAIRQTLDHAGRAMHYTEIADEIVERGLREEVGATPAATVNAQICISLKEGKESPFVRVGRGEYMLRSLAASGGNRKVVALDRDLETEQDAAGIIQAFGMYWQRDFVIWTATPSILGRQQVGADAVNFAEQKGVYLLHDGREVMYVGRSVDQPLGRRLYQHTQDRLRGRWDRFSWFGLLKVSDQGSLTEIVFPSTLSILVTTMEALLIEGLEPRQNRKRGDDFSAVEYLQAEDPEIERQQMRDLLSEMQVRLGGR